MITHKIYTSICAIALLTLGFTSCSNDELESAQIVENDDSSIVTLTCAMGNATQTRAQVELGNEDVNAEYFHWNADDSFSLYDLGSNGTTIPNKSATFSITDYNDDSPSNVATFRGECDIMNGNAVMAVYPEQATINTDGTLVLTIAPETSMGDNSENNIAAYMSSNMYMYATSILKGNNTQLSFNHLTTLVRISYTHATSTTQDITSLKIAGDDAYFGTEASFDVVGTENTVTAKTSEMELTFEGVTVTEGESLDFYLLFFPANNFNKSGTITIIVNDQSIEIATSEISSTGFTAGLRYWFDLTQDDEKLVLTRNFGEDDASSEEGTSDDDTDDTNSSDDSDDSDSSDNTNNSNESNDTDDSDDSNTSDDSDDTNSSESESAPTGNDFNDGGTYGGKEE